MPFALVLIGLIMIVTGARGTYAQFGTLVAGEFNPPSPQHSFLYFIAGLGGVGAIGYIPALRTFSRLFLALVLIGIVIADKGFFANFTAALAQGPKPPDPVAPLGSSAASTPSTGASLSNIFGSVPSANPPSLAQSLRQPGGGGFWNWSGIPSPFGN